MQTRDFFFCPKLKCVCAATHTPTSDRERGNPLLFFNFFSGKMRQAPIRCPFGDSKPSPPATFHQHLFTHFSRAASYAIEHMIAGTQTKPDAYFFVALAACAGRVGDLETGFTVPHQKKNKGRQFPSSSGRAYWDQFRSTNLIDFVNSPLLVDPPRDLLNQDISRLWAQHYILGAGNYQEELNRLLSIVDALDEGLAALRGYPLCRFFDENFVAFDFLKVKDMLEDAIPIEMLSDDEDSSSSSSGQPPCKRARTETTQVFAPPPPLPPRSDFVLSASQAPRPVRVSPPQPVRVPLQSSLPPPPPLPQSDAQPSNGVSPPPSRPVTADYLILWQQFQAQSMELAHLRQQVPSLFFECNALGRQLQEMRDQVALARSQTSSERRDNAILKRRIRDLEDKLDEKRFLMNLSDSTLTFAKTVAQRYKDGIQSNTKELIELRSKKLIFDTSTRPITGHAELVAEIQRLRSIEHEYEILKIKSDSDDLFKTHVTTEAKARHDECERLNRKYKELKERYRQREGRDGQTQNASRLREQSQQ